MLHDGSSNWLPNPFRVVVAARREATRAAVTSVLDDAPGIERVGVAADLDSTIAALRRCAPDVVVIDRSLFGEAELLSAVGDLAPAAFVVIGMGDHPGFAARALAAGAADYVRLDEAADRVAAAVSAAGSRVRAA